MSFVAWVTVVILVAWALASRTPHATPKPPRSLLEHLARDVYARLACTRHGVGVRAIRRIPRGTDPFKVIGPGHRVVWVPRREVDALDPAVRDMVLDYFAPSRFGVPVSATGPNSISISFFMNHSGTPNVAPNADTTYEPDDYARFVTVRDISPGEELTFDYRTFGLPAFPE